MSILVYGEFCLQILFGIVCRMLGCGGKKHQYNKAEMTKQWGGPVRENTEVVNSVSNSLHISTINYGCKATFRLDASLY